MNHPLQRSRQNLSRRCVVFVAERIELFFHICVKQNRDGHKIFAADMLRSAVFSGDEIVKRFRFVQIPPLAFIFGPDTKIVCFGKPPGCVVANIVDAVTEQRVCSRFSALQYVFLEIKVYASLCSIRIV